MKIITQWMTKRHRSQSNRRHQNLHHQYRHKNEDLRNRMSQERLSGLALLNINRKIDINIDDVIDRFANSGSRKLEFLLK